MRRTRVGAGLSAVLGVLAGPARAAESGACKGSKVVCKSLAAARANGGEEARRNNDPVRLPTVTAVGPAAFTFTSETSGTGAWSTTGHKDYESDRSQVFLQIIPGSTDQAFLDRVTYALRKACLPEWKAAGWTGDLPVLFSAQPAKQQRTVSEVFFAKDSRPAAEAAAKLLAPNLGRVEVKPWPGGWDYHVIVVVGTAAAVPAPSK